VNDWAEGGRAPCCAGALIRRRACVCRKPCTPFMGSVTPRAHVADILQDTPVLCILEPAIRADDRDVTYCSIRALFYVYLRSLSFLSNAVISSVSGTVSCVY